MDTLSRIKQLALHRQIRLTEKEQLEVWRDGLVEDDLIESIVNAPRIDKTIRSRHPITGVPEKLYILKGRTFSGQLIYTKGTIRRDEDRDIWYVLVSGKLST